MDDTILRATREHLAMCLGQNVVGNVVSFVSTPYFIIKTPSRHWVVFSTPDQLAMDSYGPSDDRPTHCKGEDRRFFEPADPKCFDLILSVISQAGMAVGS